MLVKRPSAANYLTSNYFCRAFIGARASAAPCFYPNRFGNWHAGTWCVNSVSAAAATAAVQHRRLRRAVPCITVCLLSALAVCFQYRPSSGGGLSKSTE
jgi:hypothetical protein